MLTVLSLSFPLSRHFVYRASSTLVTRNAFEWSAIFCLMLCFDQIHSLQHPLREVDDIISFSHLEMCARARVGLSRTQAVNKAGIKLCPWLYRLGQMPAWEVGEWGWSLVSEALTDLPVSASSGRLKVRVLGVPVLGSLLGVGTWAVPQASSGWHCGATALGSWRLLRRSL